MITFRPPGVCTLTPINKQTKRKTYIIYVGGLQVHLRTFVTLRCYSAELQLELGMINSISVIEVS